MKIKSLEIYGYGRLEQRKFDLNQDFIQIYGENETGKSTMQAFIHALLFGFPKEDEYEPRLEPRFAPQYGGKMILSQGDDEIQIERIYVHHKETVNITLNGHQKDIKWFKQLLNNISKETYKSIFSFDVLGLQEVHRKLSEDKLQAYLLQTGAFGSTEFGQMTSHIKSEKARLLNDDLTGEINEATASIQHVESLIRQKDSQFIEYDQLLEEQDKLKRQQSEFTTHHKELKKVLSRKNKEIDFLDQAKEWKALEHKLNIEPPTFPEQGIVRYTSLKKQLHSVDRDLQLKIEKRNQLMRENDNIKLLDQRVIDETNEIIKQEQPYRNNLSDLSQYEKHYNQLFNEQQAMMQDIGWSTYQHVEANQMLKDKASLSINQLEKDTLEKAQVEREINFVNDLIAKKKNAIHDLEKIKVHDERYDKAKQLEESKVQLIDKTALYEKMKDEATSYEASQLKKYRVQQTLLILSTLIFIGSAVYSYFLDQFIILTIFGLLSVLGIALLFVNKKPSLQFNHALQKDVDDLTFKVKDLQDNFDLSFDMSEQRTIRSRLAVLNGEVKREHERLQTLKLAMIDINISIDASMQELNHIKEKLSLADTYPETRVTLAITQINKVNMLEHELNEIKSKQSEIHKQQIAFNESVTSLNKIVPIDLDIQTLFHDLKTMYLSDEKNRFQHQKNIDQIALLEKEIRIMQETMQQITEELTQLFDEAKVDDETAYYVKEKVYHTYHDDLQRFDILTKQLQDQSFTYEESSTLSFVTLQDLMSQRDEVEQHMNDIENEQAEIKQSLYEIQDKLNIIDQDDSLSQLKYELAIKKNKLNEYIKNYISINYIETLVDAHIAGVKEKRLPFVIDDATEIFSYLTEGRYDKVLYQDNQLIVRASDGQIYHPTELSQSTKEILYIALRLSLIQSLNKYYPFPIIIDDAFVHFDRKRRERILEYMMQLNNNQIIYYTCNRSTVVTNKNTITLERINKEVKK